MDALSSRNTSGSPLTNPRRSGRLSVHLAHDPELGGQKGSRCSRWVIPVDDPDPFVDRFPIHPQGSLIWTSYPVLDEAVDFLVGPNAKASLERSRVSSSMAWSNASRWKVRDSAARAPGGAEPAKNNLALCFSLSRELAPPSNSSKALRCLPAKLPKQLDRRLLDECRSRRTHLPVRESRSLTHVGVEVRSRRVRRR